MVHSVGGDTARRGTHCTGAGASGVPAGCQRGASLRHAGPPLGRQGGTRLCLQACRAHEALILVGQGGLTAAAGVVPAARPKYGNESPNREGGSLWHADSSRGWGGVVGAHGREKASQVSMGRPSDSSSAEVWVRVCLGRGGTRHRTRRTRSSTSHRRGGCACRWVGSTSPPSPPVQRDEASRR